MREGIEPHPELSRFYLKSRSRVFHANCLLLLSHHGESDETRPRDLRRDGAVALLIKSNTYPGTPVISIPVSPFQSLSMPQSPSICVHHAYKIVMAWTEITCYVAAWPKYFGNASTDWSAMVKFSVWHEPSLMDVALASR